MGKLSCAEFSRKDFNFLESVLEFGKTLPRLFFTRFLDRALGAVFDLSL